MEETKRADAALCIIVISVALGALFGQAAWQAWPPEKPLDALTAISTLVAAVVALWFGLRGSLDRRREDQERAALAAAMMMIDLEHVRSAVRQVVAIMEFSDGHPLGWDFFFLLKGHLSCRHEAITEQRVQALLPLPNHCAHRVARAASLVTWVIAEMARFERAHGSGPCPAMLKDAVDVWLLHLQEAEHLFDVITSQCAKAAQLDLIQPKGEELYGSDGIPW